MTRLLIPAESAGDTYDMAFELTPETAGPYLADHGAIPPDASPTCTSLGGGVSNHVIKVTWDGECLVAKQPLPNLAVEDDWPADVSRVHNEAAAARAYARTIDEVGLDRTRVPAVPFERREEHVIGLECAPDDAVMWKAELLDGDVDTRIAQAVGRVLGAVHDAAAGDEELRAQFESKVPFDQLRVDPYHRTTARRHPDVATEIMAEARRIMSVDRTLVHGDYSPKNVIVNRRGEDPETWILDFEVAHWGDPAFDTAFMLNHLFIKSLYNHAQGADYVEAAERFWQAYDDRVPWDIEAETVADLAVLMLARVDGKSPVEYIEADAVADALRSTAKAALTRGTATLDGFREIARSRRGRL